jgi:hypothetical protein
MSKFKRVVRRGYIECTLRIDDDNYRRLIAYARDHRPVPGVLNIIGGSGDKGTLGRFMPLHFSDFKRYVRAFPSAWVNA